MGALFSKKKAIESRVTDQDRAVLQLKQQRDKLQQYQKRLRISLEKERELAKQLLRNGKKEKAKLLLRKKRFQENMIEKTENQLENIQAMVQNIEFAQVEMQVIDGLKAGNESLKKMHEMLTVEDVEKILDETQEGIEYQRELDQLLAGGLTEEDEDDILSQLDSIIKDTLPEVPEILEEEIKLPDVPREGLKDREKRVEEPAALLAA